MEELIGLSVVFGFVVLLLVIFLIPIFIAFIRNHHYKWVILVLTIFGSAFLGVGWLIALIWSLWPDSTGILDPLVNDPTTNSKRANREIYSRYRENIDTVTGKINENSLICPYCGATSTGGAFCASCGRKIN